MGRYSNNCGDWPECHWCSVRGNWRNRPCLVQAFRSWTPSAKREACERVRKENAAKRAKTLPKAQRRFMMAAAAAAAETKDKDEEAPGSSVRTDMAVVDGLGELDERTLVEGDGETDTGTEKRETSPLFTVGSKPTAESKHHHKVDAKKAQQRQPKSFIGPKNQIDEGFSLASVDGDIARIHAANWKAWPRGQEPIAADATAEDREIAELVRRGFIGVEDLQVDHNGFGAVVCPYTVRFVQTRKKGRKGKSHREQRVHVAEPAPLDAESDWWYLDDEAYAQLLSDGGAELVDWSEASSFVHVE